jgi:Ca2+-binding RTX toxin-like protein
MTSEEGSARVRPGRVGPRRTRWFPAVAIAAVAIGSSIGTAGVAHALTGTTVTSGTAGLRIFAQQGKANAISVTLTNSTFTVSDGGDLLLAGSGCTTVSRNVATCSAANVNLVISNTGDLDDQFSAPLPFPINVSGGDGNDEITTGVDQDTVNGGAGNDVLVTGASNDTIRDGAGDDRVEAGEGNDTLATEATPDGADVFLGGPGASDLIDYSDRTAGVVVSLNDETATDGAPGEHDDIRADVERVSGGAGNDKLTGSNLSAVQNTLIGHAGNDTLLGLAGADRLFGDTADGTNTEVGTDQLDGGGDHDTLDGGFGADEIFGGSGRDELTYDDRTSTAPLRVDLDEVNDDGAIGEKDNAHNDIEDITGGPGNDTLTGTFSDNRIEGRDGDDLLRGELDSDVSFFGSDTFDGGAGEDTVNYANRVEGVTVTINGLPDDGRTGANEGDNVLGDVENVIGGKAGDFLVGSDGPNLIAGLGGVDWVFGLGGDDKLDCGDEPNELADGGAGFDRSIGCELTPNVEDPQP